MNSIRISTAGSVDDGKSTLIGRLLYDTQSLSKDRVAQINALSQQRGANEIDLSLITDGLTAEREQGITIDVAHIYFNTPQRKYIIADTPGHVEYTRNMITGSSNAHVFLILIDARNGIIEQTKRHLFVAALMQIKHIVFAINKMDLVGGDQAVYHAIRAEVLSLKDRFNLSDSSLNFIPVSAKRGDNVVHPSAQMKWYTGQTLLHYLETVAVTSAAASAPFRLNVQYVIRPQSDQFHDYRAYAGKVTSGTVQLGDYIRVSSSGQSSKVKALHRYKTSLPAATAGSSVAVELEDDIDISRGDVLTLLDQPLEGTTSLSSKMCWLGKEALVPQKRYLLQYGAAVTPVKVTAVQSQLNFDTLHFEADPKTVAVNSINHVRIKSASPLFMDHYAENPSNGHFILIDASSNATVAVGFNGE